jgi:hypothetical protein
MTTAKTAKTPGPKPDYLVVENHLKCQTDEGEISIDLRIPLARLELFMDMEGIEPKDMPRVIREDILNPEDRDTLLGMRDGVKALAILMQVATEIGNRMGASLGESGGSTSSSENTAEPSTSTSDATSE